MEPSQMHPPSSESFPKTPRTQSEASWFGGSHTYKTKQNKTKQTNYLPSFIDRQVMHVSHH